MTSLLNENIFEKLETESKPPVIKTMVTGFLDIQPDAPVHF